MTNRLPLVLGLLILAGCSEQTSKAADGPAAAQTVAYMVFGLEEGTPLPADMNEHPPVFHETSAEPLTYVAESQGNQTTITINHTDDCTYLVDLASIKKSSNSKEEVKLTFDFRSLSGVSYLEMPAAMGSSQRGTTLTGANITCNGDGELCSFVQRTKSWPLRYGDKDPGRLSTVVGNFQTKFCKGEPS